MQIIPIQAVPSQVVSALLGNQFVTINIYQRSTGLFVDVILNNVLINSAVLAQNLNRIVRDAYLGFVGDLCFIDNDGSNDPTFDGLGERYSLAYLEPSDLTNVV